jgi:hypothetical protein
MPAVPNRVFTIIGRMLRLLTAGESHGKELVVVLEGLPAGVPFSSQALSAELARRRHGYGRGGRQRLEADAFEVVAGVRHGLTLGSPIAITIPNVEWDAKYRELMAVEGPADPSRRLTRPRPGHADLVGTIKYGFDDVRNVLERASARETAARVAAGSFCKAFLQGLAIDVFSHVVQIGKVRSHSRKVPVPDDRGAIDASAVPLRGPRLLRSYEGGDRSSAQGEGHGRRCLRSPRVRRSARARLVRALGSQAGRAARRSAAVDPVRERGRGRRRVRERGTSRVEGPR